MKYLTLACFTLFAAATQAAPDGQLDPTFGTSGRVKVDTTPFAGLNDITVVTGGATGPLGKTYIVGTHGDDSATYGLVGRVTYGGVMDTAFGNSGLAVVHPNPMTDFYAQDIAATADGGFVVVGFTKLPGDPNHNELSLCKFTIDGVPDISFGGPPSSTGDGCVNDFGTFFAKHAFDNLGAGRSRLAAVAARPNGSFVIATTIWNSDIPNGNNDISAVVWQVTKTGHIDDFFGTDGHSVTFNGEQAHDIAVAADGKIALVTSQDNGGGDVDGFVRYLASDGSSQLWFRLIHPDQGSMRDVLTSVAVRGTEIVAAGSASLPQPNGEIDAGLFVRLRALDGTSMPTPFTDANGIFIVCPTCNTQPATDVAAMPNGTIMLTGTQTEIVNDTTKQRVYATRLTSLFNFDPSFADAGVSTLSFDAFGGTLGDSGVRIVPVKGKPVVIGQHGAPNEGVFVNTPVMARLDNDIIFQDGFGLFE